MPTELRLTNTTKSMKRKLIIISAIAAGWLLMPQNIIGCGPQPNPKDYFTSFTSQSHAPDESLMPFWYTALLRFYDDWDDYWNAQPDGKDKLRTDPFLQGWQQITGEKIELTDIASIVYKAPAEAIAWWATGKGKKPAAADSMSANPMVQWLQRADNKPVLQYLHFARLVEQQTFSSDPWEAPAKKDSIGLMQLSSMARQQAATQPDAFLKERYSLMQIRSAFYAGNLSAVANQVPEVLAAIPASTPLASSVMAYLAGAYFKTNRPEDAALWYAKAFDASPYNRKSNLLSFRWCLGEDEQSMAAKLRSKAIGNHEKALVEAMLGMHGLAYGLSNVNELYRLEKTSTYLPLLIVRELKKLEENYFSPVLAAQPGSKTEPYGFDAAARKTGAEHAAKLLTALEGMAADKELSCRYLCYTAAGYVATMLGNYDRAGALLQQVPEGSGSVYDQAMLIKLLNQVRVAKSLDASIEKELVSPVQWLMAKAQKDPEYAMFSRNLFAQVLAPRYHAQGSLHKQALCLGMASLGWLQPRGQTEGWEMFDGISVSGLDFVQSDLSLQQCEQLYQLVTQKNTDPWDKLLVTNSGITPSHVGDVVATSHLRLHRWQEAINWLKQLPEQQTLVAYTSNYNDYSTDSVNVDPFFDYLNDWQRYEKRLAKPLTKAGLAEKMLQLQAQLDTAKQPLSKARIAYTMGSAFYNMSYYGNAWMAKAYSRSTYTWNNGKKTGWEKDYFEVNEAKRHFQMAYDLSAANKEFKAAALFMVAKCAQRQLALPDYNYENWDESDRLEKEFQKKFRRNPVFAKFKAEFGQTRFYKYAYNRCSYLRDFK